MQSSSGTPAPCLYATLTQGCSVLSACATAQRAARGVRQKPCQAGGWVNGWVHWDARGGHTQQAAPPPPSSSACASGRLYAGAELSYPSRQGQRRGTGRPGCCFMCVCARRPRQPGADAQYCTSASHACVPLGTPILSLDSWAQKFKRRDDARPATERTHQASPPIARPHPGRLCLGRLCACRCRPRPVPDCDRCVCGPSSNKPLSALYRCEMSLSLFCAAGRGMQQAGRETAPQPTLGAASCRETCAPTHSCALVHMLAAQIDCYTASEGQHQ